MQWIDCLKQYRWVLSLLGYLGLFLLCQESVAADLLSGKEKDLKDTLGGTGKLVLLTVEGGAGAWHYVKSRNPAVFLGYPALMLFTNFAM